MTRDDSIDAWRAHLEALIASLARERAARGLPAELRAVVVVDEVGSTQDLARERGARVGDVVVARRQTAGRGRFGRAWADTAHDGAALSLVVAARAPEQLVARSAVAVATALESIAAPHASVSGATAPGTSRAEPRAPTGSLRFGIKWPNDVFAPDGGKVAGILIERAGDAAIVGIGVNVSQRAFAPEIAGRARSLAMIGLDVDRLDVLAAIVSGVDAWLAAADDRVLDVYRRRDVLLGTRARFTCAGRVVEGRVVEVDPSRGIRVASATGEETLPAALTTVAVDSEVVSTT